MSDLEQVISALQESGPTSAALVGGLWAARKIAGPSFEAIGNRFGTLTTNQLDNLARIFSKSERLGTDKEGHPHPRVANRVLNEASLYDDDVMQTYTAGLISGSRNKDGSDDRPVYYLGLMDALTAAQLAHFHVLYAAASRLGPPTGPRASEPAALRVAARISEIKRALATLSPAGAALATRSAFLSETATALHNAGLIRDNGSDQFDGEYPLQTYWITRTGMLLYDWAHGLDDEDLWAFHDRVRPSIELPPIEVPSARIV